MHALVFAYDPLGRLRSDGSRTFAYDLENRLLSVSGSASLTLAYDPLGRLRQTTAGGVTRDFLYDGDALVAEFEGSTLVRRYVHGAGVDDPLVWYHGATLTDRRWLVSDHQGTIIAHTDGAGNTTRYACGPYGEPDAWGTQSTTSRFRYTGQAALPEAQLYHYKARVYDPVLGRFLQTDPIGYEDDLNLYAYVRNDPLNATDPEGLCGDVTLSGPDEGIVMSGGACDEYGTLAVSIEHEVVVGEGAGLATGVFGHADEGSLTIGTFDTTREAVLQDVGQSVSAQYVPGDVDADFAGESISQETDIPFTPSAAIVSPGVTVEYGRTDSGQPIYGVEAGMGTTGTSVGENTTTITRRITVTKGAVSEPIRRLPTTVRENLRRQGFIIFPRRYRGTDN